MKKERLQYLAGITEGFTWSPEGGERRQSIDTASVELANKLENLIVQVAEAQGASKHHILRNINEILSLSWGPDPELTKHKKLSR
ncbi:hypothetical protein LCGC14_1799510 [marine sediment metagenome]|uniref:Uncharacterized protein n=1 Tax=marine sediment metagenome TaxID=412755 RepID=A0A0F9HCS8_9ZZZZ